MMMTNKKPIIIVDGNNISHRAYHANSGLSHQGRSVAVIYGVVNILRSIANTEKPKKIIVVWDGGRSPHRMAIYPEYKGQRKARRDKNDFDWEDWNRQKSFTQKMLKALGITQVWEKSMEADDYIYSLVKKYSGKSPVKILSNDKDFHQLLKTGKVTQLVNKKELGGETELTQEGLMSIFGLTPKAYKDYLILVGDDSDNIKGFGGIGPVLGKRFLNKHGSIKAYLEDNSKSPDKFYTRLKEVYKLNRVLIDLRFFNRKFTLPPIKYLWDSPAPKPNITRFLKLCNKYNLRIFQKSSFYKVFETHE